LKIDAHTKIAGVLGYPVGHSLSPVMQNAAFRAAGLNALYLAFPVPPARLEEALRGVRSLAFLGVNVTIPHKETAVSIVDRVSPEVSLIGALNTIVNRRGSLVGYNTDTHGFLEALKEAGITLKGEEAIVIGAGGAARGVILALDRLGCRSIAVFNRGKARIERLLHDFRPSLRSRLESFPLASLRRGDRLGNAAIVINTTPVGLRGERFFPLNYKAAPSTCVFWDLLYHTEITPFLKGARQAGHPVHNGLSMLVHQGARSFFLWTGLKARASVMRASLIRNLSAR
jgi:shikimate dehydrogenase